MITSVLFFINVVKISAANKKPENKTLEVVVLVTKNNKHLLVALSKVITASTRLYTKNLNKRSITLLLMHMIGLSAIFVDLKLE